MPPLRPAPSAAERGALLRLEAAYEAWRQACEASMAVELELWTQALRCAPQQPDATLTCEAMRLRAIAQAAHLQVLEVLRELDEAP